MKKRIFLIGYLLVIGLLWFGCEPMETDKPSTGSAPTAEQLSFIVAPGADDFHFKVINTSAVKGIANWDLGNGGKAIGDTVIGYYPLDKSYTIKLTLFTSGGTAFVTQDLTQTKTDYAYFEDPLLIAISGGPDAVNGKTWVIDSTTAGHLGVGPIDAKTPVWWAAQPLDKAGHWLYDDEFTFKLVGFAYNVNTHGKTYASHDGAAKGLTAGYYTAKTWEDANDEDLTTNDAARASMTWMVDKVGETYFINFAQPGGVLGYDDGQARSYEVLSFGENELYVRSADALDARYHKLIPKGFALPTITFDYTVAATANPNEYSYSIANVLVPANFTVTSIVYDFGDGTTQVAASTSTVLTNTYMRKGVYPTNVRVITTDGTFTKSFTVNVASNHPSYVPYLLDAMIMYNDFGETTLVPMAFDKSGADGSLSIVTNPDATRYPNRSAHAAKYTKINAEWANAYMLLPAGYRFNLTKQTTFKMLVYGNAGDNVLLKLENTDYAGNAWKTATHDYTYTIKESNKWEIAEFNFAGVGAGFDWTGEVFTADITTDSRFNDNFYNVARIMVSPGIGSGTFSFHFDDFAGPHVEGLK
ncbi:PKD domain-containing protein [Williamwhitmania taraxaci]|uniref:PKD domain-containing protein n=1 Tax=Williamwhitmania taraxaci TaxID=1640674 RepID=A0A1G6N382_9BACT|nr:PKD domain-containing protein [Williamwhitmania taraxaci]SDC62151.1 hypothetical protein SAMN05216323_104015 [Williamwhitmania taraxaci]